jgi:uncharacterized protein (DUF433 family)
MPRKKNITGYVGVGIYPVPQAARIVGVSPMKIRRWIGERGDTERIVKLDFPGEGFVTFAELLELQFVHMFRSEGVSLQTIRRAAKNAGKRFRTSHPFAVKRFDTDGKSIFSTAIDEETDKEMVEDLKHGQLVFGSIIRPFFRKIDFSRGAAVRFWPLEPSGRIVLDPTRRFGQPIDSETGVPTGAIIAALRANGGQEASVVAKWLKVPLEAVEAAKRFETSLAT